MSHLCYGGRQSQYRGRFDDERRGRVLGKVWNVKGGGVSICILGLLSEVVESKVSERLIGGWWQRTGTWMQ